MDDRGGSKVLVTLRDGVWTVKLMFPAESGMPTTAVTKAVADALRLGLPPKLLQAVLTDLRARAT